MSHVRRFGMLVVAAAMLCSFPLARTTASAGGQPDLIVLSMTIELETGSSCNFPSTQLGVRIVVRNQGSAAAGSFAVDVNGAQQTVSGGLLVGANASRWFPGYMSGKNTGFVDATLAVAESNESNNQVSQFLPIPTLPAPCTPTPTPAAVGGVAALPRLGPGMTPSRAPRHGDNGVVAGVIAVAMAGALALGGAAWTVRRKVAGR